MRNWEQEQIIKKHLLGCYVEPELKQRVKALAREAFIIIACEPQREVVESNGVTWYLARWPLQRELVADHLPQRERRNR